MMRERRWQVLKETHIVSVTALFFAFAALAVYSSLLFVRSVLTLPKGSYNISKRLKGGDAGASAGQTVIDAAEQGEDKDTRGRKSGAPLAPAEITKLFLDAKAKAAALASGAALLDAYPPPGGAPGSQVVPCDGSLASAQANLQLLESSLLAASKALGNVMRLKYPDPMCPEFVVPAYETLLRMHASALDGAIGKKGCKEFEVEGPSKLPLLHVVLGCGSQAAGPVVTIRRVASLGGQVCATSSLRLPSLEGHTGGTGGDGACAQLELSGTDGGRYGSLMSKSKGVFVVQKDGAALPELVISVTSGQKTTGSHGHAHHSIGVAAGGGLPIARLALEEAEGDAWLALRVCPGVDSVLVLCSVLSALYL